VYKLSNGLSLSEFEFANSSQSVLSISNLLRICNDKDYKKIPLHLVEVGRFRTVYEQITQTLAWLNRYYPCELVYKHRIAKNILLGRHSLITSSMLNELSIGNSIADCVITNGKSVVYEIKTKFDSPEKLHSQIEDYYKAFRFVNLVVDEELSAKYQEIISNNFSNVGLLCFRKNGALGTIVEAKENVKSLLVPSMFQTLRKPEQSRLYEAISGSTPSFSDSQYYRNIFEFLSNSLTPLEFHGHYEKILHDRKVRHPEILSKRIFQPVIHALTQINPSKLQAERMATWLESEAV
jgi:hypothetical protein